MPNKSTNTFYFTGIRDWNALPPKVKEIKNYITFKDKLKQTLMDEAKKADEDQFQYNWVKVFYQNKKINKNSKTR